MVFVFVYIDWGVWGLAISLRGGWKLVWILCVGLGDGMGVVWVYAVDAKIARMLAAR